jgi:hypothetical protein
LVLGLNSLIALFTRSQLVFPIIFQRQIERFYRVVTYLVKIFESTTQHVDGPHILVGLDAKVHFVFGRMRYGITAKCHIGAVGIVKKGYCYMLKYGLGRAYYRQMMDFSTLPNVWPSFSKTKVRELSQLSSPGNCKEFHSAVSSVRKLEHFSTYFS